MNHSTQLTKRVMAKKMRDAAYPESLKNILGLQNGLPFEEQTFQNALRLLNWKLEAVSFTPTELLRILDLAVKREQEVALRTHIEKIINFSKVLALLNERHRLHAKINNQEYVVVEPEDFLKALDILRSSITETVSRIEKRQEDVLKLFATADVSLTKHDVAGKLKTSTSTAYRALRTLAQAGYLKEDTTTKTHRYELLQDKPNHLCLLENQTSLSLFHRKSLGNWLNTIFSSRHSRGLRVEFYDPKKNSWSEKEPLIEELLAANALEGDDSRPSNSSALPCRDEEMRFTPSQGLDRESEPKSLCNTENQRPISLNADNKEKIGRTSLDDFAAVYYVDGPFGWHDCAVCGQTKLTSHQGKSFTGEKLWLCEDCMIAWEKHLEMSQ